MGIKKLQAVELYDTAIFLKYFGTVQYLTVTHNNPFQIGYADGILALLAKIPYGQRSKCADLLNRYNIS